MSDKYKLNNYKAGQVLTESEPLIDSNN